MLKSEERLHSKHRNEKAFGKCPNLRSWKNLLKKLFKNSWKPEVKSNFSDNNNNNSLNRACNFARFTSTSTENRQHTDCLCFVFHYNYTVFKTLSNSVCVYFSDFMCFFLNTFYIQCMLLHWLRGPQIQSPTSFYYICPVAIAICMSECVYCA